MILIRRMAYNPPVSWDKEDEKTLLNYLQKGKFDAKVLRKLFPQRTLPSIRSKARKLRIKHDLFGSSYRDKKGKFTKSIADKALPKTVFDAYAGAGHQTFKWVEVADQVFASEIVKSKLKQFEKLAKSNGFKKLKSKWGIWTVFKKGSKRIYFFWGDALDATADLKVKKIKVDLVDLDTCGSTLPILPTILVLLKPKHIVITHGEFHSMRFKREDVLRRLFIHRDIKKNPLPLDANKMSIELDKAVKTAALRAHNETVDSFWLELKAEAWLGGKVHGMLRRYYMSSRPSATSDCINQISKN